MLRAIIFDVDGTLIDSKEFILGAFEYTFSIHGLKHLTRKDIDRVMGKPLDELASTPKFRHSFSFG